MQTAHDATIETWLVHHLSEQLGIAEDTIDLHKPLTEYGLDSMVGVSLAGDLEEWLGLQLSPTLLWDYPTIALLTHHLAETTHGILMTDTAATRRPNADGMFLNSVDAAELFANVATLSDHDVETWLGNLRTTQDA